MNAKYAQSILCLTGPTAAGKTAAAIALAQYLPIEVVSMDSAQVYCGMDIGTAKPSKAEQQQIPHHLISIVDPLEPYSAARFVDDAMHAIRRIQAKKKIPLLVGGTLLYYFALTRGLADLPSANAELRSFLSQQAEKKGWPWFYQQLSRYDPVTAARLKPRDGQRIQRAWEVMMLTGKRMSDLVQQSQKALDCKTIALVPAKREFLYERIARRFEQMLQQGFIKEVESLLQRYPSLHLNLPATRCAGYRQIYQYLTGKIDEMTMREQAIIATRRLAKHQMTWLRRLPECHTIIYEQQHQSFTKIMQWAQRYVDASVPARMFEI